MRTIRFGLALLAAATVTTVLAGCSDGPAPGPTRTVTATTTATPTGGANGSVPATTAAAAPTPSASTSCGTATAAEAVQQAVAHLPQPIPSDASARWDPQHAETSGYSPCAALSWAELSVVGGTPSSPNAILLFHDGTFLGTATAEQYPFAPDVVRTADDAIAVTYHYTRGSDTDADPTGTTHATFTWVASTGKVAMAGSTPPEE